MFYSGKFSQTQLCSILELINILIVEDIPTTFNSCAKVLLDKCEDAVEYQKEFYCVQCDVVLARPNSGQPKIEKYCLACNGK